MAATERQPLSFDDAQILGLESAAIMAHTTKALVLGPDPRGKRLDPAALRERVAERIDGLPRLRRRLETPLRSRRPAWVEDSELDLAWHVATEGGPEPLGETAFRERVGALMGERLDHERPLWRLDVLALEGERTGIVGRIHHALADGVTAILIVGGLLWDQPGGAESHPAHDEHPDAPKPPAGDSAGGATEVRRLPGALWRELRPGADSPLDRHIGPHRDVAWTSFPLARLKGIERAAGEGVTVNDVALAAVAGALRRWLAGGGQRPAALRAQVPVCLHLRQQSADAVGNKDSFLNVDLPVDEPDPARRLALINAETRERKLDHDADTLYAFFHALGRFKPLYKGVTRVTSGPREFALSVSNVPGPRDAVLVLGHGVDEFASFAEPADRHALRVSIVSLGGVLAFGFCSDPEAVPGVELLAGALEESMAELEGMG